MNELLMTVMKLFLSAAGLALFLSGCGEPRVAEQPGKLQLVATIFPLADWLHEVAGDDADVACLVDGAQNPHHFEPTVSDATRITKAKALFTVGLGLDPWAGKLAENSGSGVKVIACSAWIAPQKMGVTRSIEIHDSKGRGGGDDDDDGDLDPHFWLDPARAMIVVKKMAEELGALDPAHRDAYAKRAEAYVGKLEALNRTVDTLASSVPSNAALVTFHDAYGYLFGRLKIKIAAVVQVSPGVEPSARDVVEAVKLMKSLGQKVVFREPGANTAALQTLATELNARLELLDPMDTAGSEAGNTYVERMRHDLNVIANAAGLPLDVNAPTPVGGAK